MFGFVVADAGALSEEEKERYRAVYCGLCLALRDRYGQLSRACLTYDLTFFVLLCNSLHEPAETQGASHCVMHPAPTQPRDPGRARRGPITPPTFPWHSPTTRCSTTWPTTAT